MPEPGLFLDENIAQGYPSSGRLGPNDWQVGISDVDTGEVVEAGLKLPWCIDKEFSYLDYQCWIECELDSGIVVHRIVPQSVQGFDSLGSEDLSDTGIELANSAKGVNLTSQGNYTNIVQRMANSVYRFCLKGFGRRAGYQIPIPRLVSIGGVPAIPDDEKPQRASNRIVANNFGIPIYMAVWELWYTTAVPPIKAQAPPPNLAQHIGAISEADLPTGLQVPISLKDANAVPAAPPQQLPP